MSDLATIVVAAAFALAGGLALGRIPHLSRRGLSRTVHEWEHGLLYRDGRFAGLLQPRRYRTIGWSDRLVVTLPKVPTFENLHGVEVTSADRMCFRMSTLLVYEIVDPRLANENRYREGLQHAGTNALIRLAAARGLEALLSERSTLDAALLALLDRPIAGCRITDASIGAVTLPPELRRLYAEVERARLEGQAALERARAEQAALRSLANSARMLKGNPELMNLRLLQALATSGSKGGATLVLGREAFAASAPESVPEHES
ncbi:SPFH domain-containing protein [Methylobacterium sp. Leaf112]|jgi:regulator of protease activity HflC (stomatin/prohibitin superfamily)|uniref:SPFH domain-containing protein n=1 Tax=Methylobacterium sp. Leaf112 TaxID=1736258 RepID=UPI0006F48325|nr:SPFH domain-containing protein [Methylobacterium sp. Leaf112]KQP59578.1 hypothetical protein ASF52_11775 [Methylobacterium sp. Leaf112]